MENNKKCELPIAYVFGTSGVPEVLQRVLANEGQYQQVVMVTPNSDPIGSFYVKYCHDGPSGYLHFQEFNSEMLYELFKGVYADKAEVLEGEFAFRLKF